MSILAVATDLEMGLSAWVMLAVAVLVLGGGLIICIRRAVVVGRAKSASGESFDGGDGK